MRRMFSEKQINSQVAEVLEEQLPSVLEDSGIIIAPNHTLQTLGEIEFLSNGIR